MRGISGYIFNLTKYSLKIIFAGKFVWFLFVALVIFFLFMLMAAWNPEQLGEETVYGIMLFPSLLLVFYPAVFGIQNDEDERMLELIFGIPDYRYKVWGFRLLIIFVSMFFLIAGFSYIANIMLCRVDPWKLSVQILFPVLFFGTLAFMFSTLLHSGNGTAVAVIIMLLLPLFFNSLIAHSMWDVYLNPFELPENTHPVVWRSITVKNRIFLAVGSVIFMMVGLLNLQNREKFL
jgi:hypothetical protein